MAFVNVLAGVLDWVLIAEVIAIAFYNFIFEPRSHELNREIKIMFSAIVIGLLTLILLVYFDAPIVNSVNKNTGSGVVYKIIAMLLDVWIVSFLTRDIIIEIKIVKIFLKKRKAIKNRHMRFDGLD